MKPICKIHGSGTKCWFVGDISEFGSIYGEVKLHRIDGPAIEYKNGDKEYFLDNNKYSFEEWDRLRKMMWLL
jgi:hypothetical protein